jgi:hypothetical protein
MLGNDNFSAYSSYAKFSRVRDVSTGREGGLGYSSPSKKKNNKENRKKKLNEEEEGNFSNSIICIITFTKHNSSYPQYLSVYIL